MCSRLRCVNTIYSLHGTFPAEKSAFRFEKSTFDKKSRLFSKKGTFSASALSFRIRRTDTEHSKETLRKKNKKEIKVEAWKKEEGILQKLTEYIKSPGAFSVMFPHCLLSLTLLRSGSLYWIKTVEIKMEAFCPSNYLEGNMCLLVKSLHVVCI